MSNDFTANHFWPTLLFCIIIMVNPQDKMGVKSAGSQHQENESPPAVRAQASYTGARPPFPTWSSWQPHPPSFELPQSAEEYEQLINAVPLADPPLDFPGGPLDDQQFIRLLPSRGAARGRLFEDGQPCGIFTLVQVETGLLFTPRVFYSRNHGLGLITTFRALRTMGLDIQDLDESVLDLARASDFRFLARLSMDKEEVGRHLKEAGYPVPIEEGCDQLMSLIV